MPDTAIHAANLPKPLDALASPRALAGAPTAAFVSQLIAERQHLPPQRERRRASVSVAIGTYDAAERQAIRRLPPGYRKTVLA